MFDYTGKKIVTIDALKKETRNEFSTISNLTSLSSPWSEKRKPENMWLYKSVDKLKGIGNQGEAKMNEMNIHTVANLQRYVRSYRFPKLPIRGFYRVYEHGLESLPGKPTTPIKYHRKSKNPYLSRYGERWVENLKLSSSM